MDISEYETEPIKRTVTNRRAPEPANGTAIVIKPNAARDGTNTDFLEYLSDKYPRSG